MLVALMIGTLLALAALGFVLHPVFFGTRASLKGRDAIAVDAVSVLREIEFDKATGKLSDADYADLRATYTRDALVQMRAGGAAPSQAAGDAAEETVRRMRSRLACAVCGLRPESDASWCSSCGRYLAGTCEGCGADVREAGACFCSRCGVRLAA